MIKLENTITPSPAQWISIIMGARNPMNSWAKSDSKIINQTLKSRELIPGVESFEYTPCEPYISIGPNDLSLMMKLRNAGTDHRKFMRMIEVYVDITAPLYWWKEFDTYKVGTVANSCSTMHKIHAFNFYRDDFSCEKLLPMPLKVLDATIAELNHWRTIFINGGPVYMQNGEIVDLPARDKRAWEQMIQLLPTSYNQKRTVMMNYENLANMYKSRKNHKLDEWHTLCDWIEGLPYSELITGPALTDIPICKEIMNEAEKRAKEGTGDDI